MGKIMKQKILVVEDVEAGADGDSRLWAIKRRAVYGCLLYWTAIFLLIVTIVYSSVAQIGRAHV